MLKINTNMHSMNSLFCLQDNWRIKIAELLRVDDTQVTLKFMTIEMIDGYYLCESIEKEKQSTPTDLKNISRG